jgi:HSP20 family protein
MLTGWSDFDRTFGDMDLLRGRLNRLFTDLDRAYGLDWAAVEGCPRTNLYDTGDKFEIRAEVPGLAKEDLNVKIQGNYLEIGGARKEDTPAGYVVHRTERGTLSFCRSFTLPTDVDANKVEATIKNGILTLAMPKSAAAKPKQITIK